MQFSSLLTDFYQLTMAYGYWKAGMAEREACFYGSFRKAPFRGEYAIFAGLGTVLESLKIFKFNPEELDYLTTLKGSQGQALFSKEFLDHLAQLKLKINLDAVEEGQIVFANEPWLRVTGPLLPTQLLETFILNTINFQTLIATKAARVSRAANKKPILEFGLRRAQGADGGLSASRAAFIGGCQKTSNVLAGMTFGIPVSGTQAHSWIMCFEDEKIAFKTFAEAYPNDCVLLVDTYNTKQGVQKAIEVANTTLNHRLRGIRLDSGDLAYLSQQARRILDKAGLKETKIIASNDLDEKIIADLEHQKAKIDAYGVGTKLVTAYDQPALGGVYKLSAIKNERGEWQSKLKLSEQMDKISTPGVLNFRRYFKDHGARFDVIYDENIGIQADDWLIDPKDPTRRRPLKGYTQSETMLKNFITHGKIKKELPTIHEIQQTVKNNLSHFHTSILRLLNPHRYPVGLESQLYEKKLNQILALKQKNR